MNGSGNKNTASLMLAHLLCRISPFLVTRILANSPAGAISIRHKFQGPNHAVATACAAGADAIGDAFRLIRTGDADVMVAGGTEACVDAVAMTAFGRYFHDMRSLV
jgi:3-oxoacyl-[acyl-carrier-protein] synthase II